MKIRDIKMKVQRFKMYRTDAIKDFRAAQNIKANIEKALAEMPESERELYAEDIAKIKATIDPPILF